MSFLTIVALNENFEDGKITFTEGVESPVNSKEVTVIFLDEVDAKKSYRLDNNEDSNSFLAEESKVTWIKNTNLNLVKTINQEDLNQLKVRELTKNIKPLSSNDSIKDKRDISRKGKKLVNNPKKESQIKSLIILGEGTCVVSNSNAINHIKTQPKKVLDLSKFNFAKARELTKNYKGSFSDAVIEEKRKRL